MKKRKTLIFVAGLAIAVAGMLWLSADDPDAKGVGGVRPTPAKSLTGIQGDEQDGERLPERIETRTDVALGSVNPSNPNTPIDEPQEALEFIDEPIEEEAAEDPLERGSCVLFLKAVRAEDDEPLATHFQLYLLDAPENEVYTAGDQLQFEGELPKEGRALRDLPEGEFRVVCWVGSEEAGDPPPFLVKGSLTEQVIRVSTPAQADAFLRLYSETGEPISTLENASMTIQHEPGGPPNLPWLTWRSPKTGVSMSELSSESSTQLPDSQRHVAERMGFALGVVRTPSRGRSHRRQHRLRVLDHNDVIVPVQWPGDLAATWSAVVVPLNSISGAVWFEYGGSPDPDKLTVRAECVAQLSAGATSSSSWQSLAVSVTVEYPDHQELEFTWKPADGPVGDKFLKRMESSSE